MAQELGRVFGRQEIADAIKLCYDRSPEFVAEYLEENFTLVPAEEVEPRTSEATRNDDAAQMAAAGAATAMHGSDQGDVGPAATEVDEDLGGEETEQGTNGADDEVGVPADDEFDEPLGDEIEDEDAEHEEAAATPTRTKKPKPTKPSLIERFARAGGYIKDGDERFYHSNGDWIEKVSGHSFPWERRSASGELLRCYWPKEHCILRAPLQLDADIWELCKNQPDKYALLLIDGDDAPIEITGKRLGEMCDKGDLTLYPAQYRLVYESNAGNAAQAMLNEERL